MANFYTDTPSLRHHLHHPLMRRIVELKERNFRDKDTYDYAPVDFDDAMDSYERVPTSSPPTPRASTVTARRWRTVA